MTGLPLLLLASLDAISGEAALRHARSLAALGPHPFGSPRAQAAASYVAAEFREVGLEEIRLQPFESDSLRGSNVIGVLRAPGPEFLVVAAHHDSAPDAPGAYDDGGGVGVLIETARVLAQRRSRPRSLVFVSFDGEESESQKPTKAAGSRAYVQALGKAARSLVAALAIEMSGQPGGAPVFHPIAYPNPLRPGQTVITPAWLLRAALSGARASGTAFDVGDPLLGFVYQPAVRAFRVRLYGDDLSFLQAGLPAVFVSDSSFTSFYPHYHRASDTAERLDAAALERMGRGVLGAVESLQRLPLSREPAASWYAASGLVLEGGTLTLLGLASLVPGLLLAARAGGPFLGARLLQAALYAALLWRHPVPALFCLSLPTLVTSFVHSRWSLLSLGPAAALVGLGTAAALRAAGPGGAIVTGLWLETWEVVVLGLALCLPWLGPARGRGPAWKKAAGPKKRR